MSGREPVSKKKNVHSAQERMIPEFPLAYMHGFACARVHTYTHTYLGPSPDGYSFVCSLSFSIEACSQYLRPTHRGGIGGRKGPESRPNGVYLGSLLYSPGAQQMGWRADIVM